jgi:hypothetical protein
VKTEPGSDRKGRQSSGVLPPQAPSKVTESNSIAVVFIYDLAADSLAWNSVSADADDKDAGLTAATRLCNLTSIVFSAAGTTEIASSTASSSSGSARKDAKYIDGTPLTETGDLLFYWLDAYEDPQVCSEHDFKDCCTIALLLVSYILLLQSESSRH